MKRYLPLVLLIATIAAIIGVSQYAKSTEQHCNEGASKVQAAAVTKSDDGKAKDDAQNPCRPPVWTRYFAWPDGVGACAVILTLLVIAWQSIETRAAAKATEVSAEVSRQSVKVMTDSERPWLIAHMERSEVPCLLENGNVRFRWAVKNVGKSPAKLIEAGATVSLDTLGPSIYPIKYKMDSLDERILVPGDSFPLYIFWSIEESGRLRTQLGKPLAEFNDLAMIYGFIRYRGATGIPETYETRFSESSTITAGVCDKFEPTWPVNVEDIRCT